MSGIVVADVMWCHCEHESAFVYWLWLEFRRVLFRSDRKSTFFFSSRRRHTRFDRDWSSDVCSADLLAAALGIEFGALVVGQRGTDAAQLHAAAAQLTLVAVHAFGNRAVCRQAPALGIGACIDAGRDRKSVV